MPFIQKLWYLLLFFVAFCFKHGLTQTWLEFIVSDWLYCELVYKHYNSYFFNLVVPCWFPEYSGYCVLCDLNASLCMHLPLFFISVLLKRTTLCQHMFLHWASIVETCKTWQQMAYSTMRDSTEHDSFAHIVNLFFQKRKKTILQPAWSEMDRFQRILSCRIAVKLSLQIYCWAV